MLKSLKIKNFRCFEEFDLLQFGRVNLLVGKNNSGKTSILEAIHILNSPSSFQPFLDIIDSRGEYSLSEKESNSSTFDASHFFFEYKTHDEIYFDISGVNNENNKTRFSFQFTEQRQQFIERAAKEHKTIQIFNTDIGQSPRPSYVMEWKETGKSDSFICLPHNMAIRHMHSNQIELNSQFVSLASSNVNTTIDQFNQIVLTPQEETLYESLRIIEPGIERIAPIATQGYRGSRNGGFVVSINKQRVPISSMGYGIWRMLEITLAMVNIPGGTLLIDEIDTGLHFSVMVDLWKLICKTAEKLDIQVFATTHNSDCWKSLAEVANSDDIASDDITIHRIERGKKTSVVFNEQEMAIAAERDIEVP
jgi:AAA15 family ATPase/GTPase